MKQPLSDVLPADPLGLVGAGDCGALDSRSVEGCHGEKPATDQGIAEWPLRRRRSPQLMNAPGSETGPGPQLVTWGKSTICSVDAFGYTFQWTTNSSKHIPFDWSGP
jgi:hypothetical protein